MDTLTHTKNWFAQAKPEPTLDSVRVQLGVHLEEVSEMFSALGLPEGWIVSHIADTFKNNTRELPQNVDRIELLDSLCDQIVTAVGLAYMLKMDIVGAMHEVNKSNWSKFDKNGAPIFNENGKIMKGPNYFKPNLAAYV